MLLCSELQISAFFLLSEEGESQKKPESPSGLHLTITCPVLFKVHSNPKKELLESFLQVKIEFRGDGQLASHSVLPKSPSARNSTQ